MSVLAWHFVGDTLRDGRPIPSDGETLIHDGPIKICESGLHASRRLIDALFYSPGSVICRVACEDVAEELSDKLVCRSRTILWRVDAEELLRDFARRCALDVTELWGAPEIVVRYLRTGDESIRAAACDAACDATWGAARAAARAAARDVAKDAACDAAWDAAWGAARAASATWDAAWDRQNRRLTAMVVAARGGA